MEKRKIIRLGNSSYVLTLPNDWILKNKIKKGDKVILKQIEKKKIIIEPNKTYKIKRKGIITFEKPLKLFIKKLISLYFKNYNIIIIKGENLTKELNKIKTYLNKMSTLQIYEYNDNKIVLKDIINFEELKIEDLIRRINKNVINIFNELTKKELDYDLINEIDSNINNLTYLAYKYVNNKLFNSYDKNFIVNSINYWRIIFSLENIGDILKRVSRYIKTEREEEMPELNFLFNRTKNYFENISSVLNGEMNKKFLNYYLDEKQSLLKEIEDSKLRHKNQLNLFLVITQLLKDIIGRLEMVIVSLIDLE